LYFWNYFNTKYYLKDGVLMHKIIIELNETNTCVNEDIVVNNLNQDEHDNNNDVIVNIFDR
jgi:hypothetical protein